MAKHPSHFPGGRWAYHFADPGKMINSPQTFREYAEAWLAENAPPHGLKLSTYQDYKSALSFHLYPAIGDTPIGEVDERSLKLFRQTLTGLSPKRINNIYKPHPPDHLLAERTA